MRRPLRITLRVGLTVLTLLLLTIATEIVAGWRCDLKTAASSPVPQSAEHKAITSRVQGYPRPEGDTYLSYPEWYIVWSYQEKADFQQQQLPSEFPYFAAVRQYWGSYCCVSRLIRGKYSFNAGEQLMLVVIGSSFSAEYILKGVYEKTLGRFSEWTSSQQTTEEDQFAYRVAREYADFVHVRPFYEFRFARYVVGIWRDTHLLGHHLFRKFERKAFLTLDYSIEASYCWIIEKLTHLTYGYEPSTTYAWMEDANPGMLATVSNLKILEQVGTHGFLVAIPRYQEFAAVSSRAASAGANFVDIAGNSQILFSVVVPNSWSGAFDGCSRLFAQPILTNPGYSRVIIRCDVTALSRAIVNLSASATKLEHIYDY